MSRFKWLLVCLSFAFLVAGCASPPPEPLSSAQALSQPEKTEPVRTPPAPDPRIEQVKSMCPGVEESDLPALARASELAQNGRAAYEKYFTQKIKTGSGDSNTLSEALSCYAEADKLLETLLVKYPHSDFLSTMSSSVREDMRALEMEQK